MFRHCIFSPAFLTEYRWYWGRNSAMYTDTRKWTMSFFIKISASSPNSMESVFPVTRNCPFLYDVPLYRISTATLCWSQWSQIVSLHLEWIYCIVLSKMEKHFSLARQSDPLIQQKDKPATSDVFQREYGRGFWNSSNSLHISWNNCAYFQIALSTAWSRGQTSESLLGNDVNNDALVWGYSLGIEPFLTLNILE